MDNRIFNVNGKGDEMLLRTLQLVFEQEGNKTAKGWSFSKKHGLILHWYCDDGGAKVTPFPAELDAKAVLMFVIAWLKGKKAETVERHGWDEDADHDGHNGPGWRVFCEDWGHVNECPSAICAVKPVFLWYGK
jgi:hypothetical protein